MSRDAVANVAELNKLTQQIIGAAIEVHRHLEAWPKSMPFAHIVLDWEMRERSDCHGRRASSAERAV